MTAQAGDTLSIAYAAPAKPALRAVARRRRLSIGKAESRRHARRAAAFLLRQRCVRNARDVAVYLSCRSEMSTAALIEALLRRGQHVWAPVVTHDASMHFVRLRRARLRRDRLGIPRPAANRPRRSLQRMHLAVLPLLAFDRCGNRLGSGGGYYDRALARLPIGRGPCLVGLGYALQELPSIPVEPWDIRLHAVVTERGWRKF